MSADKKLMKISPTGYQIEGMINSGGMGSVYKAIQLSVDRPVALKVLSSKEQEDRAIQRFREEAKTLAQINHPNVVQLLDLREEKGGLFIIMELVKGTDLRDRFKRLGRLTEETALTFMEQAAQGLDAAHKQGIFHRDVKPSNLMLTLDGRVKVTDFGVAKSRLGQVEDAPKGVLMGTPNYISPEQSMSGPVDARTDVYALAATFYHLVSGTPPFVGKTVKEVILSRLSDTLIPLEDRAQGISSSFSRLILRMLDKDVNKRPQSMNEVIEECKKVRLKAPVVVEMLSDDELDPKQQDQQIRELNLIELSARSKLIERGLLNDALEKQREFAKAGKVVALEKVILDNDMVSVDNFLKVRQDLDRQLQLNENKRLLDLLSHMIDTGSAKFKELQRMGEDSDMVLFHYLEIINLIPADRLDDMRRIVSQRAVNEYEKTLVSLCTEHKLLTPEQMEVAQKNKADTPLASFLVSEKYLKKEEVLALMDVQKIRSVEHFYSAGFVTGEIGFRDYVKCPHCDADIFIDEEDCRRCGKSVKQKRSDKSRHYSIKELQVIDTSQQTLMDTPEWYIKTKTGEAGPYPLKKIVLGVKKKKVTLFTELRQGQRGPWQMASKTPYVARAMGLCFSCEEIRPLKKGPCPNCGETRG